MNRAAPKRQVWHLNNKPDTTSWDWLSSQLVGSTESSWEVMRTAEVNRDREIIVWPGLGCTDVSHNQNPNRQDRRGREPFKDRSHAAGGVVAFGWFVVKTERPAAPLSAAVGIATAGIATVGIAAVGIAAVDSNGDRPKAERSG